ncbi:MAG: hypothetical protein ACSLFK_15855 [Gemmatimonadaceae bacterium]
MQAFSLAHLRRALIALPIILTACHSTKDVETRSWGAINGTRGEVLVRMNDGSRFRLDSFSFNKGGILGIRGVRETKGQPRSQLTVPLTIAYNDVAVVQVRSLDKQRVAMALAGAVTAGYIVLAMSQSGERPTAVPKPPPVTSCPFIYSFDGERWQLDSETYAGAIAKGLERTDIDNLDHVAPSNGRYRIALASDVDETDYTDQVALTAAEHPIGTRVFPDASGVLHVVSGASTTLQLRQQMAVAVPARTTWTASFRRAPAKRVALVLRVRNTEAVPFVHQHLMNLLGRDVYSWYREVNTNEAAASRTSSWFTEMAGLHVSVHANSTRKQHAILPVVGPMIAKTFVVPIEVTDSGVVHVELESSPMLWKIESAQLVAELAAPVVHNLELSKAISSDGADVTEQLLARDGIYHVSMKGTRVTMEFNAVKPAAGMIHTIVAQTTGHYYANSTDEREGNPALVSRLMKPGLFSQGYFMLQYSRRQKSRAL